MVNGIFIPMNAESHNDGHCLVAQVAVMPKLLPRMRVANVQVDERNVDAGEGIAYAPDSRVCTC